MGHITAWHNACYNVGSFLGIPYAHPSLKSLQYNVPQPLNSSWSGVRNATTFGFQCMGYGSDTETTHVPVSEGCLVLNVIRPLGSRERSCRWGFGFMGSLLRTCAILKHEFHMPSKGKQKLLFCLSGVQEVIADIFFYRVGRIISRGAMLIRGIIWALLCRARWGGESAYWGCD